MATTWELLNVADAQHVREALAGEERKPFLLLEHDPFWHCALLNQSGNRAILARKPGSCAIGLFVHASSLVLALGDLTLAEIPIRRYVLTGGIPPDAASASDLADLLMRLRGRMEPDGAVFLQGVHDGEALRAALELPAVRSSYHVMLQGRPYQRCRIRLGSDFNAYLASLGRRTRADLKRTMRSFNARHAGSTELRVVTDPVALERELPDLIALSARTYHGKVLGLGPAPENYVVSQMRFGALNGVLRLDLLRVDGRLISFQVGYIYGNTLFSLHAGYDPEWADRFPGIVHSLLTIEDLCRSRPDVTCFDFMYGDALYKHRLSNTFHGECNFYLIPRTARGLVTWLAVNGINRFSTWAGELFELLKLKGKVRKALRGWHLTSSRD